MKVEQFVMAYGVEQDRVRAILPEGFESLRPVLRINAEVRDGKTGYLEFNAPAENDGKRGWVNIGNWNNVEFDKCELQIGDAYNVDDVLEKGSAARNSTIFRLPGLEISFTRVGLQGGCPAEKDNQGCFFRDNEEWVFREAEVISSNKEFCDCEFKWNFDGQGAHGKSVGETIPAFREEIETIYPKAEFTVQNAAVIPCVNEKVLGAYVVEFER